MDSLKGIDFRLRVGFNSYENRRKTDPVLTAQKVRFRLRRTRMAVREILLLGNPLLNKKCAFVRRSELAEAAAVGRDLRDTKRAFRARHGWGRAIAAPQIGVLKRILYVEADKPWLIINPVVTSPSRKMMRIRDDCMSFPDLFVMVKRHAFFTLTYRDENWTEHTLKIEGPLSELLQHELDHLDGILAVSHAIDGKSFALRSRRPLPSKRKKTHRRKTRKP